MKKLIYYEFCPGIRFEGVSLKIKKLPFLGIQHLVLYRIDTVYPNYCEKHWISESILIERKLINN